MSLAATPLAEALDGWAPGPHRRRMFAGGLYRRHRPIPIGAELACRSTLAGVAISAGAAESWPSSPSATS